MSFANTSVRIVGSVGDDEYANVLREACAEAGLETDFEVGFWQGIGNDDADRCSLVAALESVAHFLRTKNVKSASLR